MLSFYASCWMVGSALLYSLQNVDARFSGNIFGFWTMCVFRGFMGALLCFLLLKDKQNIFSLNHYKSLCVRSFLGGATIITSFFSIMHCGATTTTIITSTSSLWTALIGHQIDSEKYQWSYVDVLISIWCFLGIALLWTDTPSNQLYYYIGILCAFLSSVFQAGVNISIKHLDSQEPALVSFWGMMGSVFLGLVGFLDESITTPQFTHANPIYLASLLTTGILSGMAQYSKTHAIQMSSSMSVLILRYMDVVFSILWDCLLFHEKITWQIITSMVMILTGCLVKLVLRNRQPSLPQ